ELDEVVISPKFLQFKWSPTQMTQFREKYYDRVIIRPELLSVLGIDKNTILSWGRFRLHVMGWARSKGWVQNVCIRIPTDFKQLLNLTEESGDLVRFSDTEKFACCFLL